MNLPMSNSELSTFKRCKRKWKLTYYDNLGYPENPASTSPMMLGNRLHAALEGYYGHKDNPLHLIEQIYQLGYDAVTDDAEEWVIQELQKEHELAKLMLEGYMEWVEETGADADFTVIGAEQSVSVPDFYPGVTLYGKLDVLIQKVSDGRRVFLDHKSVGNMTDLPKLIDINEQFPMYAMIQALHNPEQPDRTADGGVVNMLRKVKRTLRAQPPFYQRIEVKVNRAQLNSMWHRTMGTIEEILRLREELDKGGKPQHYAYPTPMSDCSWSCPFFAVCPMMDDGSRAEDYLANHYIQIDSYERYTEPGLREKAKHVSMEVGNT